MHILIESRTGRLRNGATDKVKFGKVNDRTIFFALYRYRSIFNRERLIGAIVSGNAKFFTFGIDRAIFDSEVGSSGIERTVVRNVSSI